MRTTRLLLTLGLAVPVVYYGVQALAAPFFPGFRFVEVTASELGSDRSPLAPLVNAGIVLMALATFGFAAGVWRARAQSGVRPLVAAAVVAVLAGVGVQTAWAAAFPMPDPRHGGHPAFLVAMLALPVLLAALLWPLSRSWRLRAYLVATLLLLVAMVPVMSGWAGLDTASFRGLVQRVFTLAIYPPVAVAAVVLRRQVRELPDRA